MKVKIGTFNLNNLFGRFNFKASINGIQEGGVYSFSARDRYWIRKFFGKLVKPKDQKETKCLAERIRKLKVDVLAVQEVEDRDTLKRFNKEYLKNKYKYKVVVDANDPRLIDVGVLSRFPLGAITSWQHYSDPENPNKCVFSRDLLQVEVLDPNTQKLLFIFFITHSKSKFVPYWNENKNKQEAENNSLRLKQSEAIVDIVSTEMGRDNRYIIAGDFNDTPTSKYLAPLLKKENKLGLENIVNKLSRKERWTYIYKKHRQQLDYLLIPPLLREKIKDIGIGRTRNIKERGSDHDPVFAVLDL